MRAWSADTQRGGAVGSTKELCVNLLHGSPLVPRISPRNFTLGEVDVEGRFYFGNWSVVCHAGGTNCQALGHIAILAAVPHVVTDVAGGGEIQLEGDDQGWSSEGVSVHWLSKFDDNSDPKTKDLPPGMTYQRMHYAVRRPVADGRWRQVCLRAWVQDMSTGSIGRVNMNTTTGAKDGSRAKDSNTRCWGFGNR